MQLDLFNLIDARGKTTGGQGPAAAAADQGDHGEEFNQMLGLAIGAQNQSGGMALQPSPEGTAGQPQPDGVRQNPARSELAALRGWNLASPAVVTGDRPATTVAHEIVNVPQQAHPESGISGTTTAAVTTGKVDMMAIANAVQPADTGATGTVLNLLTPEQESLTTVVGRNLALPDKQPQPSLAPSAEPGPNNLDGRPVVNATQPPGWQAVTPHVPEGRPVVSEAPPPGWQVTAPHVPGGRPVPDAIGLPATAVVAPDRPEGQPLPATAPVPTPGSRKHPSLDGRPVVQPPSLAAVDPDHPGQPAPPDRPEPVPGPAEPFPDPGAPPAALAGTAQTVAQTAAQATAAAIRASTAGQPSASVDLAAPASQVPGGGAARPAGTAMTSSVSGNGEVRAVPQQVVRGILDHALGGRGEQRLTLQLDPEHLGRVEVRMVATADRLEIVIQAESATASQALRENVQDLIRALSGRFEGRWQQVDVKVQEPSTADRGNRDPGTRDQDETRDQEGSRDQQQPRDQHGRRPEASRQFQPQG